MVNINTVLLVVNPISGAIDKAELIEEVKRGAVQIDASLIIFSTSGKNDKENLEKLILEKDPSRIIAAGGDGTIKLVAEALGSKNIPVGIIPAGSANGLSYNLHLPATLKEQTEIALGDHFLELDMIDINNECCLHISDFGINAELIQKYETSNVRGKLGYLLQSIPTLVNSEYPFDFTITANNRTIKTSGILLAIANARSYGTGATINPHGKLNDGYFEILIFKNFDVFEILKSLRNEVEFDPAFVETIVTKEATIRCDSPVALQVDGEYLGNHKLAKVSMLPQKLRVAVPHTELKIVKTGIKIFP